MAPNKKDSQKKKPDSKKTPKIPGMPEGAKVKVIQITPKTFLYPILIVLIGWMIYNTYSSRGGETIKYNEEVGLNQIVANYSSGIYEEIVVAGNKLDAKKPVLQNVVDGVIKNEREIDRIKLPAGTNIADLTLFDPLSNPTKITIKDVSFADAAYGMIPSILGTVLMVVLFVWLLTRLSGGG